MLDSYTKVVLTVIATSLTALVLPPILTPTGALAEPVTRDFKPGEVGVYPGGSDLPAVEIPRAWGRLVSSVVLEMRGTAYARLLTFEAADGTVRSHILTCLLCEVVRK
jgi:hypothetical protein